jgi:hypothetical protein
MKFVLKRFEKSTPGDVIEQGTFYKKNKDGSFEKVGFT